MPETCRLADVLECAADVRGVQRGPSPRRNHQAVVPPPRSGSRLVGRLALLLPVQRLRGHLRDHEIAPGVRCLDVASCPDRPVDSHARACQVDLGPAQRADFLGPDASGETQDDVRVQRRLAGACTSRRASCTVRDLDGRPGAFPCGGITREAAFRLTISDACACEIARTRHRWAICTVLVEHVLAMATRAARTWPVVSSVSSLLPMRPPALTQKGQVRDSASTRLRAVRGGSGKLRPPKFLPLHGRRTAKRLGGLAFERRSGLIFERHRLK